MISFFSDIFGRFKTKKKSSIDIVLLDLKTQNISDIINKYIDKRIPFKISKGCIDWPMNILNNEYIIKKYGNLKCTVLDSSNTFIDSLSKNPLTIKEYFEDNNYLNCHIRIDCTNKEDSPFITYIHNDSVVFQKKEILNYLFFHAKKGIGALPHTHNFNAYNVLRYGRKKWIIFEADSEFSYNGSKLASTYNTEYGYGSHSKVWFDKEQNSLIKSVDVVYEFIQEQDDIVYIPEGYCHAVLNLENTMGFVIGV